MTDPSSQEQVYKIPPGALIAVVLGNIVLSVAAYFASFIGRFLSYGALETTLSESVFTLLMNLAVYGPLGIVLGSVLWGFFRLSKGQSTWWIAGLGLAALLVNFWGVAFAMGS